MNKKILLYLLFTIMFLSQGLKAQEDSVLLDSLGEIYVIVEEMPRFPGCESLKGTALEKKACSDGKFLKYIHENWKVPKMGIENLVCDRIIVSFVIDQQGNVRNINILREPGYGMGESIVQLLESMNELPQRWRPGYHNGEPVAVEYKLPIRYRLNY